MYQAIVFLPLIGFLIAGLLSFVNNSPIVDKAAQFITVSFISVAAFVVGFAQVLFIYNLISSLRNGQLAGHNPWRATTLEWQTPQTPPGHGNFDELPLVYRWPYDYSVPGAPEDFLAQNDPGQRTAE